MTADMLSTTTGGSPAPKTITICLSTLQSSKTAKKQQILVIPKRMLVNGCISAKSMENTTNLKRPLNTYGTDSKESSSINEGGGSKVVRKRANLNHLSSNEKLMRRKVKNRVAAQNARHKKREKMEEMERDLDRLKAHAKALEVRNAQLVSKYERLVAKNKQLCSNANTKGGQDLNSLPGDSLGFVECNRDQKTPRKVANQEEGLIANVMMQKILKSEDFDHISNEQDSRACEQMLDNTLEFSSFNSSMTNQGIDSSEASSNDANIFKTAWEEHIGDLYPDLRECTF